jgi:hypothetical protein
MMDVSVMNFRGIDKAEFLLSNIILLAGPNGVGKTSICLAVAAAFSQQAIPFLQMSDKGKVATTITKAESGRMVRTGYETGGVRLRDGESETQILWPQCDVKTKGKPPTASVYATGLLSVLNLPPKEQVRALADLIKAIPSADEMKASFMEAGMSEKAALDTVERVLVNGWDAIAEAAKTHGAKLKGQWETYTGESYGSAKGATWLPMGWEDVIAQMSDETLTNALANAKQALETRIASEAVSASLVEELQKKAAEIPVLTSEGERQAITWRGAQKDCEDARKAHAAAVAALPMVEVGGAMAEPLACPHCKKKVAFKDGGLVKVAARAAAVEPAPEAVAAVEAMRAKVAECRELVNLTGRKAAAEQRNLSDIEYRLREAHNADAKAKNLLAKPPADPRPVEAFRDEVRLCESRVEAKRKKEGADRAHASIAANQAYVNLLMPDGLRKRKLLRALDDFNTRLAELCTKAAYKLVSVDEDMAIRYGGRSYYLLSASEQYRVRAIFQIAFAFADGAPVVILDGADILDADGRNGMFTLLGQLDIVAVVGMTMNKPEQVPDLERAAIGVSYWMADGRIREIKEAAQAQ